MMFSGSRRRMFRNETPATKKPSLTRQAIGILASSRELMDEVQPMRMANGGDVNVIETYLDQARRMATAQGLTPGSMPYNQVVGILYNKLSSTDPSVDQLFPPRISQVVPVVPSLSDEERYGSQPVSLNPLSGLGAGITSVLDATGRSLIGQPVRMGEGNQTAAEVPRPRRIKPQGTPIDIGAGITSAVDAAGRSLIGQPVRMGAGNQTAAEVPQAAVSQAGIPSQTSRLAPVDVGALTQPPSARLRIPENTGMGIGSLTPVTVNELPDKLDFRESGEYDVVNLPDPVDLIGGGIRRVLTGEGKTASPETARGTEAFKSGTAINPALVPKTAEEKAAEYSESTRSANQRFARDLKGKQGQVTRLEKRQESLKAKLSKALVNNNEKGAQTYRLQLTELEGTLKKAKNELNVLEDVQGQKAQTKAEELQQRLEALKENPDVSQEDLQALQEQIDAEQEKIPDDDTTSGPDEKSEVAPDAQEEEVLKKAEETANANLEDAVNASGADPNNKDPLLDQVRKLKDDLKSGSEGIADGASTEEQDIVRRAMEMAEYDEQEIRDSLKKDSFWNAVMMFGLQMAAGASEGGDRFSNMARAAVLGLNEFNKDMKEKEKSAYARYRDKKADAFAEAGLELKRLTGERQALTLQNQAASTAASLANIESQIIDRNERAQQRADESRFTRQKALTTAVDQVFTSDGRSTRTMLKERYNREQGRDKDADVSTSVLRPYVTQYYREQYGLDAPDVIKLDN